MNQEPTVYPEQQTPAKPSYDAIIRGVPVGGWLYYHQDNGNADAGRINIVVTIQGNHVHGEDFFFNTPEERSLARRKAKAVWKSAVVALLAAV